MLAWLFSPIFAAAQVNDHSPKIHKRPRTKILAIRTGARRRMQSQQNPVQNCEAS
jgi:hypothetical protein